MAMKKFHHIRPAAWPREWPWPADVSNPEHLKTLAEFQAQVQPGMEIEAQIENSPDGNGILFGFCCLWCGTAIQVSLFDPQLSRNCKTCGLTYKFIGSDTYKLL